MGLQRTVALFWFTNFCSKNFFADSCLIDSHPDKVGTHMLRTQVCTQTLTSEMSRFALWLPIALWSAPRSLQFSVLFSHVLLGRMGKWIAQTHTLKVVGIKLTPLQIKVTLLVQQKRTHLPMQETWGQFPEWWRSPGQGNGNSFQDSCQGNPTDRGAWLVTIHGVAKRIRHKLVTK